MSFQDHNAMVSNKTTCMPVPQTELKVEKLTTKDILLTFMPVRQLFYLKFALSS